MENDLMLIINICGFAIGVIIFLIIYSIICSIAYKISDKNQMQRMDDYFKELDKKLYLQNLITMRNVLSNAINNKNYNNEEEKYKMIGKCDAYDHCIELYKDKFGK